MFLLTLTRPRRCKNDGKGGVKEHGWSFSILLTAFLLNLYWNTLRILSSAGSQTKPSHSSCLSSYHPDVGTMRFTCVLQKFYARSYYPSLGCLLRTFRITYA